MKNIDNFKINFTKTYDMTHNNKNNFMKLLSLSLIN